MVLILAAGCSPHREVAGSVATPLEIPSDVAAPLVVSERPPNVPRANCAALGPADVGRAVWVTGRKAGFGSSGLGSDSQIDYEYVFEDGSDPDDDAKCRVVGVPHAQHIGVVAVVRQASDGRIYLSYDGMGPPCRAGRCTRVWPEAAASAVPSGPRVGPDVVSPGGVLYVVAGDDGSTDVFRVDALIGADHLVKLWGEVGAVAAGHGRVVVGRVASGPSSFVDDLMHEVAGRDLRRLEDVRGFAPSLSADGHLSWVAARYPDAVSPIPFRHALVVRGVNGREQTLYESAQPLGGVAWGPGGSVALVEHDPAFRRQRLLVVATGGAPRQVDTGLATLSAVTWSGGSPMAVTGTDEGGRATSVLVDPSGTRTPLPSGWLALAWSPDASRLLVARDRSLGVITVASPAEVERLGELPRPARGAAWVAE